MEKISKPKVRELARGKNFTTKQMQAEAGDLLPEHLADTESVLFIHEGECILKIYGEEVLLHPGEAYTIPPETRHQIKAVTGFRGIHFMPKDIRFQYF